MTTRRTRALAMIGVMAVAAGCAGDLSGGGAAGRSADHVVWSDEVRFPEEDPTFTRVEGVGTSTLTFRYDGAPTFSVQPGDIVVGDTGGGYMRRVLEVRRDADTVSVSTGDVQLTDAVVDSHVVVDTAAELEAPPVGDDEVGGARLHLGARPPSITFPIAGPIDGELALEGHFTFQPDIVAELEIRDRRVQRFVFAVQACGTVRILGSARASIGGSLPSVPIPVPLGVPPIPVALGPIPAVVKVGGSVRVTYALEVGVELEAGVEGEACLTLGASYEHDRGTVEPIAEGSFEMATLGPDVGPYRASSWTVSVRPKLGLYVAGVAGPFVSAGPHVRWETVQHPATGRWEFNTMVGMAGTAGLAVTLPVPLVPAIPLTSISHEFGDVVVATGECRRDVHCPDAHVCDTRSSLCEPVETCAPSCGAAECGDDGCGGSCGACGAGEICGAAGACEAASSCSPRAEVCNGRDDDCDGATDEDGVCAPSCTPSCDGRSCGDDGCGGSCGSCGAGESCSMGACLGADPCARAYAGDGMYCAATLGGGGPDLLRCVGGRTVSTTACAHGCTPMPAGTPDVCAPPPMCVGEGYLCATPLRPGRPSCCPGFTCTRATPDPGDHECEPAAG